MISDNLQKTITQIREATLAAKRDLSSVRLLAVSKTVQADRVMEAVNAGQTLFGENYVQEAKAKREALVSLSALDLEFHLIGPLQRNKVKEAVRLFSLIHTVDRSSLVTSLAEEACKQAKIQNVLIQVNISGEETKSGVPVAGLGKLAEQVLLRYRLIAGRIPAS